MKPSDVAGSVSLVQRAHVLAACQHGPMGRTAIAERAECSRSTAYRATSDFREQGLLERTDNGYRLTGAGVAMLDHVQMFMSKREGTVQIQSLFEYVDNSDVVRQAHRFTDAELVTQEASNPYQIENRVKAIIDGTRERMTGMTNGLGAPSLAEAMIERIQDGVHVDWILPTQMYDQFTAEYGELAEHADGEGQTAVSVRERIPIDLAVYDETLVVIGFDRDRGVLGAVAITDDEPAVRWATDRFDECRRAAEQVE